MVASLPTTKFSFDGSSLPIETVTVYRPSGAQVIRKLDVDLKAGTNVIEVTNLSSITQTESFRVDGLGSARLLVQCALDRHPEVPKSDQIRDLKSQLQELQTEKDAREQEVAILKVFAKSAANNPDITPGQAKTFSDTLFDKILACAETVRDLDEKITRLNQKTIKIQNSKRGAAFTKAVITILADEDGPVQLRLIYCVDRAYWDPLYDLYATSEDGNPSPSVSLHYRVNLWQSTGEDWTSAKLILSTSATDILNAGMPRPDNLVIQPQIVEPPTPSKKSRFSARSPSPMMEEDEESDACFDLFSDGDIAVPVSLPQLAQSAAVISKSPMSVNYTVEALTTIPSDGISHKVLVATLPFEAAITHITTSRKSPIAYLQTNISEIATGDTFNCTLGMDTSIRVSHELTQSFVSSPPSSFVEQYMTTTYVSTTKLHNRHTGDYLINIVERSSIPIASESDPRIKVFLKGPTELAESEEGKEVDLGRRDGFKVKWGRDVEDTRNGQKEGKFIWYGTISPGEEVVLVSEWDVRAPVDAEWKIKSE